MGTRHLTMVFKDGCYKVAQYGQWDGYPSGQGRTCVNFLREEYEPESFAKHVDESYTLDQEQIEALWKEESTDSSGFVTLDVARKFTAKHPSLSRDTGAGVLPLIQKGPVPLHLDVLFVNDSLFCEWCYVLDLDKNTFEVYAGFNTDPLEETERFYNPDSEKEKEKARRSEHGDRTFYYPVRHVRTWALSDLPDSDHFIMQCDIIAAQYFEELEDLRERYGSELVDYYRQEKFSPRPLQE